MATLVLEDGIFTVGLPTAAALRMRVSISAMGSVMLIENHLMSAPISAGLRIRFDRPCGRPGTCYQLALRRPGTSPFIVALRSMLRPRPNFLYTARRSEERRVGKECR